LWKLLGLWLVVKGHELPDWAEFKGLEAQKLRKRYGHCENPADFHSLPDWLFELGRAELGEAWAPCLEALNQAAPVVLRTNRLKGDRENLAKLLAAEGIPTRMESGYPDALVLEERANVFRTKTFEAGLFEVQDAVSQLVAPLLDPRPGERVVDACAGAGGKTLHFAALMKNKGKILALDVGEAKLAELRKRASRAGADIIECRAIESSKTIKRLAESADRLLLDVPCSGTGVWKRNPDSRWKLTPENLEEVKRTQASILSSYTAMLKPGGWLVYSTCSVLPSENQLQVREFLRGHPGWELLEEKSYLPHETGFDGFYMARLRKPPKA
jgi:16S rRNA (cytosine967-C5)-methyltransferase